MVDIQDILSRYPDVWPTEASFRNWVRGGVRRGLWNKHPVKLRFMKNNRFKAPLGRPTKKAPEGAMVWACECAACGEEKRAGDCQVDHKEGENPFRTLEGLQEYVLRQILVTEDDLQWMCKECHDIKTYAERHGISFFSAKCEKEAIAFSKMPVEGQKKELMRWGVVPASAAKDRRAQYRQVYSQVASYESGVQYE